MRMQVVHHLILSIRKVADIRTKAPTFATSTNVAYIAGPFSSGRSIFKPVFVERSAPRRGD